MSIHTYNKRIHQQYYLRKKLCFSEPTNTYNVKLMIKVEITDDSYNPC